jgi:hypothetical protein
MKIYVASSWRNQLQPSVVDRLRKEGYEVYDFRNPAPGNHGFAWSQIDPEWQSWDAHDFREALTHPIAEAGYKSDLDALEDADATVLVMPCGRSAHLELGVAVGMNQRTVILLPGDSEPELMYKLADQICLSLNEVVDHLARFNS